MYRQLTNEELVRGLQEENTELRRTMDMMRSRIRALTIEKNQQSDRRALMRSHSKRSPSVANTAKRGTYRAYGGEYDAKSNNEEVVVPPRPLISSGKVVLHRVRARSNSQPRHRTPTRSRPIMRSTSGGSTSNSKHRPFQRRSTSPAASAAMDGRIACTARRSIRRGSPSPSRRYLNQAATSPVLESRLRHLEEQHRELQLCCDQILGRNTPVRHISEPPGPWHHYGTSHTAVNLSDRFSDEDIYVSEPDDYYTIQPITPSTETCWM
eukprot:TRINITY_DN13818_c0_g3_i1.p1 TRINITY_DN13818_c0_g3~~TRINITY_DN13818_c0_g3_i1.p1  ORF type:complete len:267 (+),score=25.40 TRINITY_DN13818_c0_g3_i1:67-867(+)